MIPNSTENIRKQINDDEVLKYLNNGEIATLKEYLIQFGNYCINEGKGFFYNKNFMVCSDDIKKADEYGIALGKMMESWLADSIPGKSRTISASEFLRINRFEGTLSLKGYQLITIKDFESENTKDFDLLYKTLSSYEENNWLPITILCCSTKAAEAMKAYEKDDARLYNYYFGSKMTVDAVNVKNIIKIAVDELEAKGYRCAESFKEALSVYIEAIYAEAVLKESEFVKDLLQRIYKEHFKNWNPGSELTEKDVPYSAKAEKIKAAKAEAESKKKIPVNEVKEWKQDLLKENNGKKNVLLLALSAPNKEYHSQEYFFEDYKDPIVGWYQLEPIPKMLKRRGLLIDEIIMLRTDATKAEQTIKVHETDGTPSEYKSAEALFRARVSDCVNHELPDDGFMAIDVVEKKPAKGIQDLSEYLRGRYTEGANLYIDAHGGLRGIQRILEAVVSLLKREKFRLKKVYSVEYIKDAGSRIIDETQRFKIFEFVAGVNELLETGRNDTLKDYMKTPMSKKEERQRKKNQQQIEHPLISAAEKLSVGVQWADVDSFDKGIEILNLYKNDLYKNGGNTVENSEHTTDSGEDQEKKIYLQIFENLIMDDFAPFINKDGTKDVLDKVKWCVNKKFYQLALTMVESKMGEDLKDWGVVTPNKDSSVRLHKGGKELPNAEKHLEWNILINGFVYTLCNSNKIEEKEKDVDNNEKLRKYVVNHLENINCTEIFCEKAEEGQKTKESGDILKEINEEFTCIYKSRHDKPTVFNSFCFDGAKDKDELLKCFVLHTVIKNCRNDMNHLGDKREEPENIKAILDAYIQCAEDLRKFSPREMNKKTS